MPREEPPSAVPATAQQDGDVLARWGWTEPAVWTQRMLTALEEGVQGGKWFRLIDKVFAERNLLASYGKVAANGGAPVPLTYDEILKPCTWSSADACLARPATASGGGMALPT